MPSPDDDQDDDYGTEIEYDDTLELALQEAEAQARQPGSCASRSPKGSTVATVHDIEDAPSPSPFQQFRKRGFLSVSDLVATVWCEVQYDYRLRTLPYLPPEKRPEVIKSAKGAEIRVDKVKVQDKEKILKRGEKIHLKLEKEIFPEKISVDTVTPEEVWGLRLLTMISSLEALLSGGKCRELPVVGFVGDTLVFGIIDEVVRRAIKDDSKDKSVLESSMLQTSLDMFLRKAPARSKRTHSLFVSDSKTRASDTLPKKEDAIAGKLQLMLYKELLDVLLEPPGARSVIVDADPTNATSLLPTNQCGVIPKVFATVGLDPDAQFSTAFLEQATVLIFSNGLRHGAREARNLNDLVNTWHAYVRELGLGPYQIREDCGDGITDNMLELVYRRATGSRSRKSSRRGKKVKRSRRGATRKSRKTGAQDVTDLPEAVTATPVEEMDEDSQLQLAIQMSLALPSHDSKPAKLSQVGHVSDDLQVAMETQSDASGHPQVHSCRLEREEPTNCISSSLSCPSVVNQDLVPGQHPASSKDGEQPDSGPRAESITPLAPQDSLARQDSLPPQGTLAPQDTLPPPHTQSNTKPSSANSPPEASLAPASSAAGQRRPASPSYDTDSEREREEDQIAWAVELEATQAPAEAPAAVTVPVSSQERPQGSVPHPASSQESQTGAGDIIGSHKFKHDRRVLATHLRHVLGYWQGTRDPQGVGLRDARRCNWCEFEESCEWRNAKANEAWALYRSRQNSMQ